MTGVSIKIAAVVNLLKSIHIFVIFIGSTLIDLTQHFCVNLGSMPLMRCLHLAITVFFSLTLKVNVLQIENQIPRYLKLDSRS